MTEHAALYAPEPALTVESALNTWQAIREDLAIHLASCTVCRPDITVCYAGQMLSESERRCWRLLHDAREAAS